MKERIRQIAYFSKSALFTIVVHGVLIAALLIGLWWPYSQNTIKRGTVQPIKAQAISAQDIQEQVDKQKKKLEEQQKVENELEELKKKQEEEKKKLEEIEIQRKIEEKKKQELEEKEKLELDKIKKEQAAETLKLEKEKKQIAEAEKKRKADEEKKKKEAEEKKRKEDEKRKKQEAEKKRKADAKKKKEAQEKRLREEALKKQLDAEQLTRTRNDATTALSALVDRIAAAVENNWRRPLNSASGLKSTIRVKVSRSGEVLSANVVKSSGDSFFDKSAELAVKKASPLPFPSDPKYYEFINEFDLLFKPDDF
jgi:colicin import membrane protein